MTTVPIRLIIVTGVSGSGKTTALRALEDLGFFCIDNLPILLLPRLLELATHANESIAKIALVVDAREGGFLAAVPSQIFAAREAGHAVQVVFLDAADDVLLRRFSETRRKHPLADQGSVEAGIAREREALDKLRDVADECIDTSGMNVHDLKSIFQDRFSRSAAELGPSVTVLSFGFKHGLPPQSDIVLDCRFLPNPHFVEELQPLTGLDPKVAHYVLDREDAREFLDRIQDLIAWLLPHYQEERKAYLTLSIGCTGGRHRSVAIAERLAAHLTGLGASVSVRHRDAGK